MSTRLDALRDQLSERGVSAFVISDLHNVRYLSGFTGSSGTLVVTADRAVLITDSRYAERALAEMTAADAGTQVETHISRDTDGALAELLDTTASIGLEANNVTWARIDSLRQTFESLHPTTELVERQREIKELDEVARIRAAGAIADAALAATKSLLELGPTEREFADALDDSMRRNGADRPGFDTIVAAGPNTARPHHEPGDRPIRTGDLVIVDFGAELDGYRSDMTRSFVIGSPSERQQALLEEVRSAQAAGIASAGPDTPAAEVDRACRSHLETVGLGDHFIHGTGHGVGLVIHEAPWVNAKSTATLAPGHVITVEPGAYVSGFGGVRWEDTLVITETGAEPLTRSPKDPIIG